MSEIVIREYAAADQAEVLDLILDIQQNEFGIAITKADQPDLSTVEQFYQSGTGNFWVALCDNRIVGTIALLDIGNKQAALRKMFTHKDYRGAGHNTGKMLLLRLLAWAQNNCIEDIYLGTTEKFLAAHRFYEKNGFKAITRGDLPATFPVMTVDSKFYQYKLGTGKTAG